MSKYKIVFKNKSRGRNKYIVNEKEKEDFLKRQMEFYKGIGLNQLERVTIRKYPLKDNEDEIIFPEQSQLTELIFDLLTHGTPEERKVLKKIVNDWRKSYNIPEIIINKVDKMKTDSFYNIINK